MLCRPIEQDKGLAVMEVGCWLSLRRGLWCFLQVAVASRIPAGVAWMPPWGPDYLLGLSMSTASTNVHVAIEWPLAQDASLSSRWCAPRGSGPAVSHGGGPWSPALAFLLSSRPRGRTPGILDGAHCCVHSSADCVVSPSNPAPLPSTTTCHCPKPEPPPPGCQLPATGHP